MRICRDCGIDDTKAAFKKASNWCRPCEKLYLKGYRKINRARLSANGLQWKRANRERYRANCRKHYANSDQLERQQAVYMRSPKHFLRKQLSSIRSHSKNPGPHDPKDSVRRQCDVTLDYIMSLWDAQQGRCALTKLPMTHMFDDMLAVSIDRIDSSRGHVVGNIQLVCQAINRMKNNHTNEEALKFLGSLRAEWAV